MRAFVRALVCVHTHGCVRVCVCVCVRARVPHSQRDTCHRMSLPPLPGPSPLLITLPSASSASLPVGVWPPASSLPHDRRRLRCQLCPLPCPCPCRHGLCVPRMLCARIHTKCDAAEARGCSRASVHRKAHQQRHRMRGRGEGDETRDVGPMGSTAG